MEKFIDLHTHTNKSDGTLCPCELIELAHCCGLSAIAITDHDNIDGINEAKDVGYKTGIEVIAGVELAAEYKSTEIHILAYFLDYEGKYFLSKLEELKQMRAIRNEKLNKRLISLGFNLSSKDLAAESKGNTLTRLHFAKAMYKKGYVKSVKEAFAKYLEFGCPAYVDRNAFSYAECIDIIKNSGGVSVLAHPFIYRFNGGEVGQMIEALAKSGLNGIEAIYPLNSQKETLYLHKYAKSHNLLITGGSDFHGENKPDIKLGVGKDNIKVSCEILERLKAFWQGRCL